MADDLERELDAALNARVAAVKESIAVPQSESTQAKEEKYDDLYFDSDDEDGNGEPKPSRTKVNDEDLFYDPQMDEQDESWMQSKSSSRFSAEQSVQAKRHNDIKGVAAAPQSDGVLNCPACMTVLTVDCQQHEKYATQFRAMFVMNCKTDMSKVVQQPSKDHADGEDDEFHPTHCAECNTLVAMMDADEVFHFFNVLAS